MVPWPSHRSLLLLQSHGPQISSFPASEARKKTIRLQRRPDHAVLANFFFLASAAMRSASEEKGLLCLLTPVGLSPGRLLELSRPLPRNLPPRPSPSIRPRFLESRFVSDDSGSSSLPSAVWPVPKRFARSNAFDVSASAPSAPVSPLATAALVPKRSARALRLAISESTSEEGRLKAKEAAAASAASLLAAVVSVVSVSVAAGAASVGADVSEVGCATGSGTCAGGAVVESAGRAEAVSKSRQCQ